MAALPTLFSSYAQPLNTAVHDIFNDFTAQLPEYSADAAWAFAALEEYSLRPSKRIRGSLAASVYDYATGEQHAAAGARLGAAIEIAQNHLLVIDDVMDRSVSRRGQPTVHELHRRDYAAATPHESNMIAVQVGMLAYYLTNHALLSLEAVKPAHTVAALATLQRHMAITDMGQIDDMQQQVGKGIIHEADLLRKYQQKSSYYSFVDPIETALLLAGHEAAVAKADAEGFGIPAGVAFQLRDDYLGIFGETAQTGKPNLDDIREGKYTLMVHYALQSALPGQKDRLLAILGDHTADEASLAEVRDILEHTGAAEQAMSKARDYATQAKAGAERATSWDEHLASTLVALANFSVERMR